MKEKIRASRVLVIEDSPIVALSMQDMLTRLGVDVAGPAGTIATALQLAAEEQLDAAIVDLNIRGSKTFSILAILERRKIPFLIASGYADWTMPEKWLDRPRLQKPFNDAQLRARLDDLLNLP